jgi:hypothetical protein
MCEVTAQSWALLPCSCHVIAPLGMSPHRIHVKSVTAPHRSRGKEASIDSLHHSATPARDDLVDQALVRAFELPVAVHVGVGKARCLAELLSHAPALLRQQHGMTWHCITARHATIQGKAMRLHKVRSCDSYNMTWHGTASQQRRTMQGETYVRHCTAWAPASHQRHAGNVKHTYDTTVHGSCASSFSCTQATQVMQPPPCRHASLSELTLFWYHFAA